MTKRFTLILLLAIYAAAMTAGCGPKDVDPNAKVDAPGYYNGPMKGKGAKGSEPAPAK